MKRAVVLICISAAMLFGHAAFAMPQMGGAPPIRVESDEVLVPVYVSQWNTLLSVPDLKVHDFRLFEDGKEQRIQQVTAERAYGDEFLDNFGVRELDGALTPGQKWVMVLQKSIPLMWRTEPGPVYIYFLSYVPPNSSLAKCHKIKVQVRGGGVYVDARDQYCDVSHPVSDPLAGTPLSNQMEDFTTSDAIGKVKTQMGAGFLFVNGKPRVYITAEFPLGALNIDVLELAYTKDGGLVLRSSDIQGGHNRGDTSLARLFTWNHHEAEMELSPGDYELHTIVSADGKFGKAESHLIVPPFDREQIDLSSVFICRQFHKYSDSEAPPDPNHPSTLRDFTPLVSKGREFTPTADTAFQQKDIFFAYYEVYDPLLAATATTAVQTRLRIINTATNKAESDTGWQNAAEWVEPGDTVIHVAPLVRLDKTMAQGSYRIEVQASDSAGRITETRTATFGVD